MANLQD